MLKLLVGRGRGRPCIGFPSNRFLDAPQAVQFEGIALSGCVPEPETLSSVWLPLLLHAHNDPRSIMSEAEINGCLTGYYRCPEKYVRLALRRRAPTAPGYFLFGEDTTCYGTLSGATPAQSIEEPLHDVSGEVETENGTVFLPFDPGEVIANLYREIYVEDWRSGSSSARRQALLLPPPRSPCGSPQTPAEIPPEKLGQATLPALARRLFRR